MSLDSIIHAPARLRIVAALAQLGADDQLSFSRLQDELDMTAGNLSTHVRRLEDAGYVLVEKTFRRRTPVTYLSLTEAGRAALARYRKELQQILGGAGA